MTSEHDVRQQLQMVLEMTEANQEGLRALEDITRQQATMIDKQSGMIDKMWEQVQPILIQHRKRQQIRDAVMEKMITGVAWGVATGVLFLLWKGAVYFIHQDNGGA